MKSFLVMVGRTDDEWLSRRMDNYIKRIERYGPFKTIVIQDIKKAASMPENVLKEKEGEAILKNIAQGDLLVLLDERGKQRTSREFAAFIQKIMLAGTKNLYFVIGGAYGFSEAVYNRADHKISLSLMTFPHQLVRLLFAEQLYRAHSILNKEPYHHD